MVADICEFNSTSVRDGGARSVGRGVERASQAWSPLKEAISDLPRIEHVSAESSIQSIGQVYMGFGFQHAGSFQHNDQMIFPSSPYRGSLLIPAEIETWEFVRREIPTETDFEEVSSDAMGRIFGRLNIHAVISLIWNMVGGIRLFVDRTFEVFVLGVILVMALRGVYGSWGNPIELLWVTILIAPLLIIFVVVNLLTREKSD